MIKSVKTGTLMSSMPIVAAAYGRKFKVPVQVGGQACTNGKGIYVPLLPEGSGMDKIAWGYLTHEAAHLRYTDFSVPKDGGTGDTLVGYLTNLLEDVRIELKMRIPYPGTAETLESTRAWAIRQGILTIPSEDEHPVKVMTAFLLTRLGARVLGYSVLNEMADESEALMRRVFPRSTVAKLMGHLTKVSGMQSTNDALALALEIRGLLEEEQETPDDSDDDAPGDDEGQPGDSDDEADDEAAGDDEGQPGDSDDEADDEAAGDDEGQPGDSDDDTQKRANIASVLSSRSDDLPEDLASLVANALSNEAVDGQCVMPIPEPYSGNTTIGGELLEKVQADSRGLTAKLQGLIQAHRMDRQYARRTGQRVVQNRLHRAGTADSRVFAKKRQRTAVNTAIHILVDLSGSMEGGTDRVAMESAMALALALKPVMGVSTAITGFPGSSDDRVRPILASHEHIDRVSGRFALLANRCSTTPMTEGLWFVAADLVMRPEDRKVAVVMTDGQPNDIESTQSILTMMKTAGIEVAPIAIGPDVLPHVTKVFGAGTEVLEAADLKAALFGIAKQMLAA